MSEENEGDMRDIELRAALACAVSAAGIPGTDTGAPYAVDAQLMTSTLKAANIPAPPGTLMYPIKRVLKSRVLSNVADHIPLDTELVNHRVGHAMYAGLVATHYRLLVDGLFGDPDIPVNFPFWPSCRVSEVPLETDACSIGYSSAKTITRPELVGITVHGPRVVSPHIQALDLMTAALTQRHVPISQQSNGCFVGWRVLKNGAAQFIIRIPSVSTNRVNAYLAYLAKALSRWYSNPVERTEKIRAALLNSKKLVMSDARYLRALKAVGTYSGMGIVAGNISGRGVTLSGGMAQLLT